MSFRMRGFVRACGLVLLLPAVPVSLVAQIVDASSVPEERSHRILGVPALTPETALLWQSTGLTQQQIPDPGAFGAWDDWSSTKKTMVVAGIVVGLLLIALLAHSSCSGPTTCGQGA